MMDANPIVAVISAISAALVTVVGAFGVRAQEIKRRERRQADVPLEIRKAIECQEAQHQAAMEQHREIIAMLGGLLGAQERLLAAQEKLLMAQDKLLDKITELRVDVARKG